MKRVSTMVQDRTGSLTHALEEAIGAHRIVKVFGGEKYESGKAPRRCGQAAALDGEAGGGVGARHADQPDHRLDRRRRHPVGRGAAGGRRTLRRRRFHHLSRRAPAPHESAEDAVQRAGGHAARAHGGGECFRADRRTSRARCRHGRARARAGRHPFRAGDEALCARTPGRRCPTSTSTSRQASPSRWSGRPVEARQRSST